MIMAMVMLLVMMVVKVMKMMKTRMMMIMMIRPGTLAKMFARLIPHEEKPGLHAGLAFPRVFE